jgi:two-component system response regulator (stage 0 sporulation protein F)
LLDTFKPHAEIVAVDSGTAALAMMARRPVALVITDYQMPEMEGLELTSMIKAASPTTQVTIVSVDDQDDVARRAKAVAAEYVLPKPFILAQLQQIIEEHSVWSSRMTPDEIAIRREHAQRWAHANDMHGYPARAPEDETEETLAATPPARSKKRPKTPREE